MADAKASKKRRTPVKVHVFAKTPGRDDSEITAVESRPRAIADLPGIPSAQLAEASRVPTQKTQALPPPQNPGRATRLSAAQLAELSLFGHHLFERGRIDESRIIFEAIVAIGVRDAFPHTMLGTIYLALRDPDKAIALFDAALAFDPNDLAAIVYRAEVRMQRGQPDLALKDLRHALKLGKANDPFVARARRLIRLARVGD